MSTTLLKLVALICMTVDHIGEFNVLAPTWFRWIGRLAAPIFVFCTANGLGYTKDRKKYMIRMYILSLVMTFINAYLNSKYHDVYITNNIFSTLLPSCIIAYIGDIYQQNKKRGKWYIFLFSLLQVIGTTVYIVLELNTDGFYSEIFSSILINVFFNEGGILLIVLFLLCYYHRHCKRKLMMVYIVFSAIYTVFYSTNTIPYLLVNLNVHNYDILYNLGTFVMQLFQVNTIPEYGMRWFSIINYYWMIIFALPFILLYNGKKGSGYKYFFYVYYPLHIYVLYFIFLQ